MSYWGLTSPPASPPTPYGIDYMDLISNKLLRQHWQLNLAPSPDVRLLVTSIQEGVTPEDFMPMAMLGGIVGAEGSIGQTHPRENKAGSSTQDCQLGENGGDESLWQHIVRVRGRH